MRNTYLQDVKAHHKCVQVDVSHHLGSPLFIAFEKCMIDTVH